MTITGMTTYEVDFAAWEEAKNRVGRVLKFVNDKPIKQEWNLATVVQIKKTNPTF